MSICWRQMNTNIYNTDNGPTIPDNLADFDVYRILRTYTLDRIRTNKSIHESILRCYLSQEIRMNETQLKCIESSINAINNHCDNLVNVLNEYIDNRSLKPNPNDNPNVVRTIESVLARFKQIQSSIASEMETLRNNYREICNMTLVHDNIVRIRNKHDNTIKSVLTRDKNATNYEQLISNIRKTMSAYVDDVLKITDSTTVYQTRALYREVISVIHYELKNIVSLIDNINQEPATKEHYKKTIKFVQMEYKDVNELISCNIIPSNPEMHQPLIKDVY